MANDIKPQDLIPTLLGEVEKLIGRTVALTSVHIANVPGRTLLASGRPAYGKQVYRMLTTLGFTPTHLDALYTYGGVRKDAQYVTTVSYNSLVGVIVVHTTIPKNLVVSEAPTRLKWK